MRLVLENEIMEILEVEFGISDYIKVTKSLQDNGIETNEMMEKLKKIIQDKYHVLVEDISSNCSILELVDYINNQQGYDKISIRDMFLGICEQGGNKNAIIFDDSKMAYSELKTTIEKMVVQFQSFGVKKGDRIAIILPNSMEYILSYFALFYIGALPVPINIRWGKQEVYNVLDDSGVEFIICEEKVGSMLYGSFVQEYIVTKNIVKHVWYLGDNLYGDKGIPFEKLYVEREDTPFQCEDISPNDSAMISYTSGTTGIPKGVVLKNNDIVKISCYSAMMWTIQGDDTFPFSIAPLYSAQGFLSLLINFALEQQFKMISSFNPNDILKEISKCEVTVIHTQPTMWTLLLNCRIIDFTRFDSLSRLVVSGSLCSPELAKRIEQRLGCTLLNAYGLIEGTSVVTMTRAEDSEDIRFNTVGRPLPGISIKIVDDKHCEVPFGEVGELAIKGYNMQGYYNNAEKTKEVLDDDGWLYTGDLAKYYDDENISIVGRCKDMVIRGGFNVYPSDIEEYLLQISEVQTAAVVGKENTLLGEELVAFIVTKAGYSLTKDKVISYLYGKLANYKIPDKVYFISEMPIILAGKIDKNVLREWAVNGIPAEKQIFFEN